MPMPFTSNVLLRLSAQGDEDVRRSWLPPPWGAVFPCELVPSASRRADRVCHEYSFDPFFTGNFPRYLGWLWAEQYTHEPMNASGAPVVVIVLFFRFFVRVVSRRDRCREVDCMHHIHDGGVASFH